MNMMQAMLTKVGSSLPAILMSILIFALFWFLAKASKDAFSNLMAGIMVLLYQPFKIGDNIQVGEHAGTVTKMSLRYTHLQGENKEILIPNASLLTNNIIICGKI